MDEFKPHRRINRTLLTVIILLAAAAGGLLFHIATDHNIPFDSKTWREETTLLRGNSVRNSMVNHLQKNVLEHGMTRPEIQSLLGESDAVLLLNSNINYDFKYYLWFKTLRKRTNFRVIPIVVFNVKFFSRFSIVF